ncbi:MAG: ATP-binding cassette domain-containing protein [Rhodospirillaceae bacterium]
MRDTRGILPLAAEGLVFEAGGRRVVDGIDLTIRQGERVAFVGPNGAGKTLTLRMLHGLSAPSAGSVRWAVPKGETAGRRRHAMVFQNPVMLRRSARANVVHALSAAGFPGSECADRADAVLGRYGLASLAGRPARVLSGGEQQRLAIARAAALEPEAMFLDEPSSALDPGATRQIEEMLADLHAGGVTLVFATHDLGQARRLAGRIAVFNRGRIVEDGPADRVLDAPCHPAARAFVAGELLW